MAANGPVAPRIRLPPEGTTPAGQTTFYRGVDPAGPALVRQDFRSLATAASGRVTDPDFGGPWVIRGYAWGQLTQVCVRNGFLVDDNLIRPVTYLGQRLAVRPRRVEMVGVWRTARADGTVEAMVTIALCRPTGFRAFRPVNSPLFVEPCSIR